MAIAVELCERGLVPDFLVRHGMRRYMESQLRRHEAAIEEECRRNQRKLAELRSHPLMADSGWHEEPEIPLEFFQAVLGPHMKSSGCYFPLGDETLAEAEELMLRLVCEHAALVDGQRVLDLGCGFGALSLWMASRYPRSRIVAVAECDVHRDYVLAQVAARGLTNVLVVTASPEAFSPDAPFDRVVSVESFGQMRNYEALMGRIASWLQPGGRLFVQLFCHRDRLHTVTPGPGYGWLARHFFAGGVMPAENTLLYFQGELKIEEQWRVAGIHYARTAAEWLYNQDRRRDVLVPVLARIHGEAGAERWFNRWRMFFLAVAVLFDYAEGTEWFLAHYRFRNPQRLSNTTTLRAPAS